ncbi:MAG: PAS domain S-box protein [Ignavibacteriaceae bacterium]|nr:PAS domain S-box protein [Ignavibacteriaceae bacterium]
MRNSICSYKNLFTNNKAIMLIIDPETSEIEDCNLSACSFYGCTYEEMLKLKITDINTLSEQQVVKEMSLAKAGQSYHFYFKHRLSNGQTRDVEVHSTPITFNGKSMLSSVIWDITNCNIHSNKLKAETILLEKAVAERTYQLEETNATLQQEILTHKETEETLKNELAFTQALLENIQAGVIACDSEGKRSLYNKVAREWHGLDDRKQIGDDWSEYYSLFQEDGLTPLKADEIPLFRVFQGEILKDAGMAINAKNQATRYAQVNGSPLYKENGEKLGAIVSINDITEQRKAEEALRRLNCHLEKEVLERTKHLEETNEMLSKQKEQLDIILENMSDALLIFDREGHYIISNKSQRETFSPLYGHLEKIGDSHKRAEFYDDNGSLIPHENMPARRVYGGEKIIGYRMKVKAGDNSLYFETNGTPIFDKNGNLTVGVLCCRDVTEKTNLEETLKESEAKYRELVNNMPFGLGLYKIITDAYGKPIDYSIMEVNPAFETIKSYKRKDIIGKKVTELSPCIGNSVLKQIEMFGQIALTGKPVSTQVHSDRTNRWYDTFNYCPKPGYVASIFADITIRKNQEKELKETKGRLQEAQEFAHLGYWEFDRISGENPWSDELFRICGFTPQEFIPTIHDFMKIVHPDDKEFIINIMREPLMGAECELDLRVIRQDNETIWVHEKIKYEYNASGSLARTYGVVQDITKQKLSEVKLKESEEKFKEFAENLGEVIWVRQDGNLVYINPAYEKVWGSTCQSLYDNSHSFIDAIHPDDKERIIQRYLKENDISNGLGEEQYKIIRPDGAIRWIWTRKYPIYDTNGKMIRILGISEDITKIKDLEEEALKNKMEQEMARLDKLSLVGAVAAGIGHEIRNPMTTVRGYLQLLGSKAEFSNYNSQFALMIDELDRANSIITEFLSLAKDRVVELKVQSLKEIVENIFPLIQADGVISDKYIHMELEEVEEIPLDKKEIHQLILNFVLNGSQAMSPGGTMKIRTYMDKGEIVLAVQDDGPGIAPEVLVKIGTPFFTTKENGTGLGLAVCYSIAARHNAKIDIETGSTGTTFFVRFKK